MTCTLCQQPIERYSAELHRLHLDEEVAVDICDACAHKLVKWHAEKLARLFPTRTMKRLHGKAR